MASQQIPTGESEETGKEDELREEHKEILLIIIKKAGLNTSGA